MKQFWIALLFAALPALLAQQEHSAEEEAELRQSLGEAGNSPADFMRVLEDHLARYPKSAQKEDIEHALVKAAMDSGDNRRLLLYGERLLQREQGDAPVLERVARALLDGGDPAGARRALDYARRLEQAVKALPAPARGERNAGRKREEMDRVLGKAYVYQSRAFGTIGKQAEAIELARGSFSTKPLAEAAREIARWLERSGKVEDALAAQADAFALSGIEEDSARQREDRRRLGEWYVRLKGSEAGLGDLMLASYDRMQQVIEQRRSEIRKLDPNWDIENPMEFTLSGMNGERLDLSSLRGKVVVLDFWATWCGPCRAQQPLYEEVKQRFQSDDSVVFLNINTDEDRSVVKPFLEKNRWKKTIYFEDGLSSLLRVSSIPTTLVVNRKGEISSRMNGYIADRFVDMLSDRIRASLAE